MVVTPERIGVAEPGRQAYIPFNSGASGFLVRSTIGMIDGPRARFFVLDP